jgi:phosphoribosylcarboxyaminoimidazole (NCAIR) mutase
MNNIPSYKEPIEQAHRQPTNLKTFATTAEHDNLARPADHLTGTIDGRMIHMVGDTPEFIEGKLV